MITGYKLLPASKLQRTPLASRKALRLGRAAEPKTMRSLLAPLILALALAALCCCEKDSKDPSGSPSAASIKIKREVANAFVRRQKRSDLYEWYFEYYKSPMEQMHERCENYPPCDFLSDQIGFSMAYNRFFGRY